MMWVYYSATVFIIGAALIRGLEDHRKPRLTPSPAPAYNPASSAAATHHKGDAARLARGGPPVDSPIRLTTLSHGAG